MNRPTEIRLRRQSRLLAIRFDDDALFELPFELLRVYSPSAEVQGHGPGQEVLQTGKREVELTALEPVGNYAVQPRFSPSGARIAFWAADRGQRDIRTMSVSARA